MRSNITYTTAASQPSNSGIFGEQQQPGAAESNLLILWRRTHINSKIDPKEHWVLRCGRLACIETFGGVPDFATSCRTDPRVAAALVAKAWLARGSNYVRGARPMP
jgi:hypothetical protein